jgi:hypothetical protein
LAAQLIDPFLLLGQQEIRVSKSVAQRPHRLDDVLVGSGLDAVQFPGFG